MSSKCLTNHEGQDRDNLRNQIFSLKTQKQDLETEPKYHRNINIFKTDRSFIVHQQLFYLERKLNDWF